MSANGQCEAQKLAASAAEVKRLLQVGRFAALATQDISSGIPYASLVNFAAMPDGAVVLLISSLARHTANLQGNANASLLITDPEANGGDVLTGSRVTLMGLFTQLKEQALVQEARTVYLARHPSAAGYAGFADFGWWRLETSQAHLVQGFGRIFTLDAGQLA